MAKGMLIAKDGATEQDRSRMKLLGLLAMLGNTFYEVDRAVSMDQATNALLRFFEEARNEWPGTGVAMVDEVWAMGEELGFRFELREDLPEPVGGVCVPPSDAEKAMWH